MTEIEKKEIAIEVLENEITDIEDSIKNFIDSTLTVNSNSFRFNYLMQTKRHLAEVIALISQKLNQLKKG